MERAISSSSTGTSSSLASLNSYLMRRVDRIARDVCELVLTMCIHPSSNSLEGQTMAQEKKGAGKPNLPAPSAPIARCLLELHPHARVPEPAVDSKRTAAARIDLAVCQAVGQGENRVARSGRDRKSTRLNSSHDQISYAVFCLKKKKRR